MRQGSRIVLRVGCLFRKGDIAGRLDEGCELTVGDERGLDPEPVYGNRMGRCFFRIVMVGAHCKGAARDPYEFAYNGRGVACAARLLLLSGLQSQRHPSRSPRHWSQGDMITARAEKQ